MSGAIEAADAQGPLLQGPLSEGISQLSSDATVTFTAYDKVVLPIDGYVFWLRRQSVRIAGSIHFSAAQVQDEAEMLGVDRVVFTTTQEIVPFNQISPRRIFIGDIGCMRFGFSKRGLFYPNAGLFHYEGQSINPVMQAQLLENELAINAQTLIVSNSLPAWLALQTYTPLWLAPKNPEITLYPSFLVADNEVPPYGAVHIEPSRTRALQSLAMFDAATATHNQLATDYVRISLFGLTNAQGVDFLDLITQYCRDDRSAFGLMNTPIIRDEKRTQVEISAIAMKKTIEVEVSYYQSRVNDIALQHIEQVMSSFQTQTFP